MADKDKSQKSLQEYPDVFADIFNTLAYGGKRVLNPERLRQIPGEIISSPDGVGLKQLERDLFMEYADDDAYYLMLGIDDQDDVDNTMPLRGMGMDYAAYEKQVRQIMAENKSAEKDAGARKIFRHQKLIPVVTLILYFGNSNWYDPKSLNDMLKMPDEQKYPGISKYIHDYGMNLVVLKNLTEEEEGRFQSDFKYLVKYLRNCKNPEKVLKMYREEFGVSWEETLNKVMNKCKLEDKLAREYMTEFWV